VPDELLVQFKSGNRARIPEILRQNGASLKRRIAPGLLQIKLPAGATVPDQIDAWRAIPEVEYAAPNAYGGGSFVPNDTIIARYDLAWNLRNVGAYGAWDVVTGKPDVVLAIIDSGVAFENHPIPDYEKPFVKAGRTMYRQSPELPGPFLPGYDFVHDDDHPNDDNGHGTMCSTIAAGLANNVAGSAGIAFGVTILPVKVLDNQTITDVATVCEGLRFAADQGANIANLSLGFPSPQFFRDRGLPANVLADMFEPLRRAVDYAQRRGVILVAAAGNFHFSELGYPAAYPGVIAVGATGEDNHIASYSSWGNGLSFVAPGGDFTELNGDHVQDGVANLSIKPYRSPGSLCDPESLNVFFFFGTSGAAPHVSGAAALLMSLGVRDQGSIEQILRQTAIEPFSKPNAWDEQYGFGLIQIDKAVQLAALRRGITVDNPKPHEAVGPSIELRTPNPTAAGAGFAVNTAHPGYVRMQLFDVRGALVRTLEAGRSPAGTRSVRWDGRDERGQVVGNGVYFFRVESQDGVTTRRIAVLH